MPQKSQSEVTPLEAFVITISADEIYVLIWSEKDTNSTSRKWLFVSSFICCADGSTTINRLDGIGRSMNADRSNSANLVYCSGIPALGTERTQNALEGILNFDLRMARSSRVCGCGMPNPGKYSIDPSSRFGTGKMPLSDKRNMWSAFWTASEYTELRGGIHALINTVFIPRIHPAAIAANWFFRFCSGKPAIGWQ